MSVLIKGMEMPKHCGECSLLCDYDGCYFCGYEDGLLYTFGDSDFIPTKRPDKCPLTKVPILIVCNMQLTDFEEMWKDITDGYAYGEYLVSLMYKYDFEHSYRTSIEVVDISPDGFTWFNDWNEGEKNVIIQSYIKIDDLYNILLSP